MSSGTTTPATVTGTVTTQGPRGGGRRGGRRGNGGAGPLSSTAILVISLLWLIPSVGMLITSFRSADDASATGWWTIFAHPGHLTVQNYRDAISQGQLGDAFVNSFAIALPATFIPILIAAFAAYAFAFMEFWGRNTLFVLVVSLLVVPNYVALVPMLKLYSSLHLNGSFMAAWLFHTGFAMSLAIYIFRNYMFTLPREVLESAKIDGASHFQTFWKLIVPMSTPALASFAIFQFLWVWNDLLVALVFVGPGPNQPLTIAVKGMMGQQGQGWQLVTAGGFFTMIVPIVVFLSLQRYFVRGLTAGSVKG